jgi:uncharacterized protein YndB with AHSA1/START domain
VRKWTLRIVVALVALVALALLAGYLLPAAHVAARAAEFRATPARVYDVVSDFAKYPEWRTGVTKVDVATRSGEAPLVTEHTSAGVIPYSLEVIQPPSKLVMRIADPNLGFGGTWTFEIFPNDSGSELVITEHGEIHNPFFRVMSKLFFSPTDTIDTYLADLRRRLGG